MRVKIANALTAAQQAAVPRAAAYRGKQPYIEFFADCVIWYKNDWAVIIPIANAAPYYWEAGVNNTLTSLEYTPPTTFGSLGTVTQPAFPYAGTIGARTATANGTNSVLSYSNWVYDDANPSPVLFYTPSSINLDQPAAFTNSLDPSNRWHWLNGTCTIKDSDASVVSTTLQWTPCFPRYELLVDSAAWNAVLLARHTAVIDTFRNATPPTVSESPAETVTLTVSAASALAHASISAAPTGLSSAALDAFENLVVVVTAPKTVTLVPDTSGAQDTVVSVTYYDFETFEAFAVETVSPFTHDLVFAAAGGGTYFALYRDASDEIDTAPLSAPGLLSRVDFFEGETLLESIAAAPYETTDPALAEGEYVYSATVYDDDGAPAPIAVTVSAVGPALTGDALAAVMMTLPINGRDADEEHAYARPYFDGTFWQRGGVAKLVPLSPKAGTDERGMYFDQRLSDDLSALQVEGYARIKCGSAADLSEPFTVINWVAVPPMTLDLPTVGSTDFPMYAVKVSDAANYGVYPASGWWYDEVEQEQKVAMAAVPPPNFAIALLDFVRDTLS